MVANIFVQLCRYCTHGCIHRQIGPCLLLSIPLHFILHINRRSFTACWIWKLRTSICCSENTNHVTLLVVAYLCRMKLSWRLALNQHLQMHQKRLLRRTLSRWIRPSSSYIVIQCWRVDLQSSLEVSEVNVSKSRTDQIFH